jgi:hypothetical protein
MNFKVCNTCGRSKPDDKEHYTMVIKKGGVWGTVAKCRKCSNEAKLIGKYAKKIHAKLLSQGVTAQLR